MTQSRLTCVVVLAAVAFSPHLMSADASVVTAQVDRRAVLRVAEPRHRRDGRLDGRSRVAPHRLNNQMKERKQIMSLSKTSLRAYPRTPAALSVDQVNARCSRAR